MNPKTRGWQRTRIVTLQQHTHVPLTQCHCGRLTEHRAGCCAWCQLHRCYNRASRTALEKSR